MFQSKRLIAAAALLALALCAPGCLSKPMITERQYMFEYAAPRPPAWPPLKAGLAINDPTAAAGYIDTAMIFRSGPYQRQSYNYNRWRVTPAEMVGDFLLRDFQASGLFEAVFDGQDDANARFFLDIGVEDLLADRAGGGQLEIALLATLTDIEHSRLPQRVVFQKRYAMAQPMASDAPEEMARAASQAMEALSRRLIGDCYQAMAKRLAQP